MRLLYISKDDRRKQLRYFFAELEKYFVIERFNNVLDKDDLIAKYKEFKPDVVIFHHNKYALGHSVFRHFKTSYNIYWRNDERLPLEAWYTELQMYFHLFLTSSEDSANAVQEIGGNAQRLMMGFNPINEIDEQRLFPLVFTGQNTNRVFPLSHIRESLVKKLMKRGDFDVFGAGWGVSNEKMHYSIYRKTKIGIAINHYNTEKTYSNRMYQIMDCGALCLAYKTKGLEEVFGDNVVYFESYKEMESKIRYYLNNPIELEAKAQQGKAFVNNHHTWRHKALDIINILIEGKVINNEDII